MLLIITLNYLTEIHVLISLLLRPIQNLNSGRVLELKIALLHPYSLNSVFATLCTLCLQVRIPLFSFMWPIDRTREGQGVASFNKECVKFFCYYGNKRSSSSSSCQPACKDFPDSSSPPVSIVCRSREDFQAISCISTELFLKRSSWSPKLCSSIGSGLQENIAYELVLNSSAVFGMSGSPYLASFRDGW